MPVVWEPSVEEEIEGLFRGGGQKEQDLTPFKDVPRNVWFDGVVARTAPCGAFVTVTLPTGESADGLLHISHMDGLFDSSVEDEVYPGQEVRVRVEFVNVRVNRPDRMWLSMKHVEDVSEEESEEEEVRALLAIYKRNNPVGPAEAEGRLKQVRRG